MKELYQQRNFRPSALKIIQQADEICQDYANQGYVLTLRQLYYQFVARSIIPNKDSEYDKLGSIVNAARLAGLLDWDHIEDRTRNLTAWQHFESPQACVQQAAEHYHISLWEDQPCYVEVWVEKEALAGVVERAARKRDVPYFSCRGYVSQSEMKSAGERLRYHNQPRIIHLGDHDPSGIDMTRDIEDRLRMFMAGELEPTGDDEFFEPESVNLIVDRIALNMDQVRTYNPPPNPAKLSDSRCYGYIKRFGAESWELDALNPETLENLILSAIDKYIDPEPFEAAQEREAAERDAIQELVSNLE